jgi:hypothetical protein
MAGGSPEGLHVGPRTEVPGLLLQSSRNLSFLHLQIGFYQFIIPGRSKMSNEGLTQARELTGKGFYYDNLVEMAECCRQENHPDRVLSAYILNRVFTQLADELGDGPVVMSELRKLEARYRTTLNFVLEKAIAGAPQEEQNKKFVELIQLLWAI